MRKLLLAGVAVCVSSAAHAHGAPDSFADLAAGLLPAVVNISSTQTIAASGERGPDMPQFPPGSPFEKFFQEFMNKHGHGGNDGDGDSDEGEDAPPPPDGHPHRMQSLGSGFIVDPAGIIVTNNHVIDGADEITVTLQDNTTLKATLIGHDDRTDIAVLQVHPDKPLPAVHFGDSDASRVGDWVLAIGNPFSLGGSVSAGIVSARGRDIQQGPYDDFIQTDAAINKGNSGGPLFNMAGEVIGINTAIYSPSGGSIGIGFSIPSDEAKNVVEQLRHYGRPRRGWLGVRIQQVTPDIAESLGLHGSDGALIAGVNAKGPADQAHIQNGDVILTFNGQKLHDMRSLPRVVAETPVDAHVPVELWRNGHLQTVTVTVLEMPEEKAAAVTKPHAPASTSTDFASLGLKLSALTDDMRAKYHIDAQQKGIVITDVAADGTASSRGLKVGDVIVEVAQQAVFTPSDLQKRLADARARNKKTVLVLVQGSDGFRYTPLPVEAERRDK